MTMNFENPFDAGYNAGMYGANTFNSYFKFFNTKERMKEWQRGNDLGSAKREAERQSNRKTKQGI